MKKSIFVGILLTGTLLAGCGEDESSQELATMKQQYTDLETKYEKLSTDYAKLQEQYDQTILDQDVLEEQQEEQEEQEKQRTAQLLKEYYVSSSPKTPQGPYQTLVIGDGEIYKVEQMMLSKQPNGEDNAFELAFQQLFPQLTFNEVVIHDNHTITIDFNENSTGSPNLTASAQVATFFDMLEFFLYYNFPDLKAYYLYSNGEPTSIGETGEEYGVYTQAQPNNGVDFENLYLDISYSY